MEYAMKKLWKKSAKAVQEREPVTASNSGKIGYSHGSSPSYLLQ